MPDFKTVETDNGKRADIFVSEKISDYSRAALKPLFKSGFIKINHIKKRPGYKLRKADVVSIDDSIFNTHQFVPDLPVVYEDEDVVAINKPAGILTHSKGAINYEPTVASFIRERLNDNKLKGNRAGIVHRLDRGTSGVIITAKNTLALKFLQKQFSSRRVSKTYTALVHGIMSAPRALIDVPIERNPKQPQSFRVSQSGKQASTVYKLLKTIELDGKKYSLLELKPKTGRTHQLRVHLAYIGHPIVGDRLYGNDKEGPIMLHAAALGLSLPNGRKMEFKAPLPSVFKNFMGS